MMKKISLVTAVVARLVLGFCIVSTNVFSQSSAEITVKSNIKGLYGNPSESQRLFSLSFKDTDMHEAFAMLAEKSQVNIILGKGVSGDITVNLYNVTLDQAVRSIARAQSYEVEKRYGSYFILAPSEVSANLTRGHTTLKTFKIQYTDITAVESVLKSHLSKDGKITALKGRNMVVVEDTFDIVERIAGLIKEIDKKPRQILIEAKILEVSLNESETFGIDWSRLVTMDSGTGTIGARGFANPGGNGLFFDLVTPDLELALSALSGQGRVKTLSTPKLLAIEDQEASVVIGDRIGYRLTTTVNQVTTESIEFLESGVILKVKPAVDLGDRILLDIHPEVSNGSVLDGIPTQTTTEVTTQLLVAHGETVFIGGLIKRSVTESESSIPLLGDIPILGGIFSSTDTTNVNTETVVMITPYLVDNDHNLLSYGDSMIKQVERELGQQYEVLRSQYGESINMGKAMNKSHAIQEIEQWEVKDENVW